MTARRWFVDERGSSAGLRLADVLARLGDPSAAREGRAFVDRARAVDETSIVPAGSVVEVWAPRAATTRDEHFEVLSFCGDLLVASKPAAWPTTADHRGHACLVEAVEAWLSATTDVPRGRAHPVSRLDVGVSGAVLFALTHEARKSIEEATTRSRLVKRYVGIARGRLGGSGTLDGAIGKERHAGRARAALRTDGRPSTSRFRALAEAREATLLELEPLTGRTHQLRLHLAAKGNPLYGDRAHGGPARITSATGSVREVGRVLLHAQRVELSMDGRPTFYAEAPIPPALRESWSLLDGDAAAWNALESSRAGSVEDSSCV